MVTWGKWPIQRHSKLKNGVWVDTPLEKGNCFLLIEGTLMLVINKDVSVESVCLTGGSGDVKCFYANDHIGVSIDEGQKKISKFKIRFKDAFGKGSIENCLEAAEKLKKFVLVTEHALHGGRKLNEDNRCKTIPQMINELLESNPNMFMQSEFVLPEGSIFEMIQQCLLDPGFPALVGKVENFLENRNEDYI